MIPNDPIERNLIPFAKWAFETLIEDRGNIEGPETLRKLLDGKLTRKKSLKKTAGLHFIRRALKNPHGTLFSEVKDKQSFSTEMSRAFFCLALLRHLQSHYEKLSKETKKYHNEKQQLAWIPQWTKAKARAIEKILPMSANNQFNVECIFYMATACSVLFFMVLIASMLNIDSNKKYEIITPMFNGCTFITFLCIAVSYLEHYQEKTSSNYLRLQKSIANIKSEGFFNTSRSKTPNNNIEPDPIVRLINRNVL